MRRPTSRTIRGVGHALFDRDAELAELAALLERARKGDGGTLLFEGPGGIGKTALLAAGEELASGFAVLRGRGGEVERELSFGLVRELFDPLLRAAPQASRERWLSGAASAGGAVFQDARAGVADAASVDTVTLPAGFEPQAVVAPKLRLFAPSVAGQYLLVLDIVTPEAGSLTAKGIEPAIIRVNVAEPAAVPSDRPATGPAEPGGAATEPGAAASSTPAASPASN